jgi:hypothetical protein
MAMVLVLEWDSESAQASVWASAQASVWALAQALALAQASESG